MRKEVDRANRYLVHNIRDALVHFKLLQRHSAQLALGIERTLNIYREMIDDIMDENGNDISDGKNSKDE